MKKQASNRRSVTEESVRDALRRVLLGKATHPSFKSETRLSVSSVAREARVGHTTIYRFPNVVAEIKEAAKVSGAAKPSKRALRRNRLTDELHELKRKNQELLDRNYELTIQLAQYGATADAKVVRLPRRTKSS
jgi:beta-glucosidase-like glycosyl hydrolase